MLSDDYLLSEIPKNWQVTRLEECVEILDSQRIPINNKERQNRIGGVPYYGATGQVGWIDDYLFDEELVLLGEDGAPFLEPFKNKAYIIKGKSWVNNHAHVLKMIRGSNTFLCHYLNISDYRNCVTGTTRLKLNQSSMRKISIPLPPLPEQNRIVAKIEELFTQLDKGVDELHKIKAQLKQYRQSVLKYAFEGKLTKEWREANKDKIEPASKLIKRIQAEKEKRYKEACEKAKKEGARKPYKIKELKPINTAKLFKLPKYWGWERVLNLSIEIFDGPFGSKLKTKDYTDSGVRVIRLENIGFLEFKKEKTSFVTTEKYQSLIKHTVFPGDILFASFISDEVRTVVLPQLNETAIAKADCFCIRLNKRVIDSKYFVYMLSSKPSHQRLIIEAHGATRPRINTNQLKNFEIPLCSLKEQQQIVSEIERCFSIADEIEKTVDDSLKSAEHLRQTILKKAFTGKLVPQDDADEPASELLKRIKAEKAKLEVEQKKQRKKSPATKTRKKAKPTRKRSSK